jgi:hypothetical protein
MCSVGMFLVTFRFIDSIVSTNIVGEVIGWQNSCIMQAVCCAALLAPYGRSKVLLQSHKGSFDK